MKNISVIKFGSQLHSNYDKYSDRDLLVVTDSLMDLKELYDKYTSEGWSVSAYTYSKLKYLSEIGSLFIDHLKICSVTLTDSNRMFKAILEAHKTKMFYENDIRGALEYFKILAAIPDTKLGYAWFCDCFYVGLRNYLVFKNASFGNLEFSFLNLIENLLRSGNICKNEYKILKELRALKFNYRADILDKLPAKQFVEQLVAIGQSMRLFNKVEFIQPDLFSEYVSERLSIAKFNGYQRLRLVEGLYCSKNRNMPIIKNIVSNPQFYACRLLNDRYLFKLIDKIQSYDDDELVQVLLIASNQ
jgi:hypothetical protein